MVKVSIVIPVHNTSAYLHRCFDSCISQTLQETEIIAIDDRSTDNSPEIIRQYTEKYPDKFRGIYLPENLRQGGARNVGIREAKGEYITFVDSDDFIHNDMCRALYENANGADLSGGDYCVFTDEGVQDEVFLQYTQDDVGEMNEEKTSAFLRKYGMFWTRIYKRFFLLENELFFPEKLFFEDAHFNFISGLCAKKISKTKGAFYYYYQSPNSTTRNKKDKRRYERIPLTDRIFDDCVKKGLYEKFKYAVDCKFLGMSGGNILYTCLSDFEKEEICKLYDVKKSVKQRIPDYKKTKAYKDSLSPDERYYFDLTMISPKLSSFVSTHKYNIFIRIFRKAAYLIKYER